MGKGACITKMSAVRNHLRNTIKEKNQTERERGGVKDMELSELLEI